MLAANLSTDPPVELGSTLAYALSSMRNYVQMSVFDAATDDQILDVVCAGLDWARAETPSTSVMVEAAR